MKRFAICVALAMFSVPLLAGPPGDRQPSRRHERKSPPPKHQKPSQRHERRSPPPRHQKPPHDMRQRGPRHAERQHPHARPQDRRGHRPSREDFGRRRDERGPHARPHRRPPEHSNAPMRHERAEHARRGRGNDAFRHPRRTSGRSAQDAYENSGMSEGSSYSENDSYDSERSDQRAKVSEFLGGLSEVLNNRQNAQHDDGYEGEAIAEGEYSEGEYSDSADSSVSDQVQSISDAVDILGDKSASRQDKAQAVLNVFRNAANSQNSRSGYDEE